MEDNIKKIKEELETMNDRLDQISLENRDLDIRLAIMEVKKDGE